MTHGDEMRVCENAFPILTEFLDKCLYQSAADSFEECVLIFKRYCPADVPTVVNEIHMLLQAGYSDNNLAAYLHAHCDYEVDEDSRKTLEVIRDILGNPSMN